MNRFKVKNIRRWICLMLCLSLVFLLPGCDGSDQQQEEKSEFAEYWGDQTYFEHCQYLAETYVTLTDQVPSYLEMQCRSYHNIYAGTSEAEWVASLYGSANLRSDDRWNAESAIPVWYGLLMRTEEYEERMGIDNSATAAEQGYAHALKAESVEHMMFLLARDELPVVHGDVAGAVYLEEEGLYVYDELIHPYQEFFDRGWEMEIIWKDPETLQKFTWGSSFANSVNPSAFVIWRSPSGEIYDLYGNLLMVPDDPSVQMTDEESFALQYITYAYRYLDTDRLYYLYFVPCQCTYIEINFSQEKPVSRI